MKCDYPGCLKKAKMELYYLDYEIAWQYCNKHFKTEQTFFAKGFIARAIK